MPYLEQFMQQWKAYLLNELISNEFDYRETLGGDSCDIKVNTLIYFSWLRTASKSKIEIDESRDDVAWTILERQLRELAKKAEQGSSHLVSKMHLNERQVQISLTFSYDAEQHIVYVS